MLPLSLDPLSSQRLAKLHLSESNAAKYPVPTSKDQAILANSPKILSPFRKHEPTTDNNPCRSVPYRASCISCNINRPGRVFFLKATRTRLRGINNMALIAFRSLNTNPIHILLGWCLMPFGRVLLTCDSARTGLRAFYLILTYTPSFSLVLTQQ